LLVDFTSFITKTTQNLLTLYENKNPSNAIDDFDAFCVL
jgi:hypothetical protein